MVAETLCDQADQLAQELNDSDKRDVVRFGGLSALLGVAKLAASLALKFEDEFITREGTMFERWEA